MVGNFLPGVLSELSLLLRRRHSLLAAVWLVRRLVERAAMPVTRSTHYFGDKPADAGTALEVVDQKVERPHLPLLRRPVLGRLPRRPILTEGRGDEGGRPARVGHGAGEQRLQLVEADLQCVVALEAGGPLQLPDQQCTPISRERTPRREGARPSSTEGRIRRAALQPIIHKMRRGFAGTQHASFAHVSDPASSPESSVSNGTLGTGDTAGSATQVTNGRRTRPGPPRRRAPEAPSRRGSDRSLGRRSGAVGHEAVHG